MIAHWRKGARDALDAAKVLQKADHYAAALFHCHLGVEKALKAACMESLRRDPPFTHDLLQIARLLKREWSNEEEAFLADLSQYAVASRYDDPAWAEREATRANAVRWIDEVERLLSILLP